MERVEGQSSRAIGKLLVVVEDLQRRISQLEPSSSTKDVADTDDAHPKNIQQKDSQGSTVQDEEPQDGASDINSEHGEEGPGMPGSGNDGSTPERQLTIATKFFLNSDPHQRASFRNLETDELLKVQWDQPVLKASQIMDPQPGTESEDMDITAIRVDSPAMGAFFDRLAGSLCDRSNGGVFGPVLNGTMLTGTTFYKPFRFLLQYHGHIKEHVKLLAEKAEAQGENDRFATHPYPKRMDQAYLDSSGNGGSEASEKTAHTPGAHEDGGSDQLVGGSGQISGSTGILPQLQHLLAFMDNALGAQLKLYEDARQSKLRTMQFRDLWMLFKPGDIIYTPERRSKWNPPTRHPGMPPAPPPMDPGGFREGIGRTTPQAYKVTAVAGGRPHANSQLRPGVAAKMSNTYTRLKVLCYYVDFNGTRYDCVADTFEFTPFDGEAEIQALEAYPLTYAHEPREPAVLPLPRDNSPPRRGILDFLQRRGRDYIRVSEASHRLYEGITVGAREEVSLRTDCYLDVRYLAKQNKDNDS